MIKQGITFSGSGGQTTGNLYQLEKLVLGELGFPNIAIITCNNLKDVSYQLILRTTMFSNLIYEIADRNKKINVTMSNDESVVRRFYYLEDNAIVTLN